MKLITLPTSYLKHCLAAIVICLSITSINFVSASTTALYKVFETPPQKALPFARWWWNGNCIEEQELLRELDVLKQAGFGGIEINPISMPAIDVKPTSKCHDWLSPEWNKLLKTTIDAANEKGLASDLIVGSGWPFGGRFLKEDELLQGIGINRLEIKGPTRFKKNVRTLLVPPGDLTKPGKLYKEAGKPELFFLTLVPRNTKTLAQVTDLMPKVDKEGNIDIEIKDGVYDLHIGTLQNGFRAVTIGAPGADGPVMDHFNGEVVRRYLDRMANKLSKVLGGELGDHIRSSFCDSIELSGANWNADFADKFKKRNGYDITPWLPLIIQYAYDPNLREYRNPNPKHYGFNYTEEFNDKIKRARYDFYQTLIDVYNAEFVSVFHKWSNENGLQSRYQAYGHPWLIGISEGNLLIDIPESNNWLFRKPKTSWIWNIYATSGANISGKPVVAVESMTNTRGVFQTTLEQIKHADDDNFISGINHSVVHGFNYSPPQAGFPGWVRYGTYFSEHNTWWPYISRWTTYNARLSSVFQAATAKAQVAILAPFADRYSETGLTRDPIQYTPAYVHALWRSLSQNGYNTNYLNEQLIQQAKVKDSILHVGHMQYQIVLVAAVQSMHPETAKALKDIAERGVKVVFVGKLPDRSPGMLNAAKNDREVKKTAKSTVKNKNASLKMPPKNIAKDIRNEDTRSLTLWSQATMKKQKIQSPVTIVNPQAGLFQRHYAYGEHLLVFFSNQNTTSSVKAKVKFSDIGNMVPWVWSPETAERKRHTFNSKNKTLELVLQPVESILLVFDQDKKGAPFFDSKHVNTSGGQTIEGPWKLSFSPRAGKPFSKTYDSLFNFAAMKDKTLKGFSGRVSYEKNLILKNGDWLDLNDISDGVTEVYINGKKIGTRWYGRHQYQIQHAFSDKPSALKIVYTSTLTNEVLSMKKDSRVARKWMPNVEPRQQGILGPIVIH